MKHAAQVEVHGHVQGVGFRYFVHKLARRNNIHGWVRNTSAGTVKALFVGDASALQVMRQKITSGSGFSRVQRVDWETITDGVDEQDTGVFQVVA